MRRPMLSRFDQREILTSLHGGVLQMPLWNGFLARLARGMGADGCSLTLGRKGDPVSLGEEFAYRAHKDSLPRKAGENGDPVPYQQLRPGRVYSLDEFILPDDDSAQAYLADVLEPRGQRNLRIMRIASPETRDAWLTIWRGHERFSAADASFLADLAPHLAIALQVHAALEAERVKARGDRASGHSARVGRLTLDAKGYVIEMDEASRDLLRRSAALAVHPRGRLTPEDGEADRTMNRALRSFRNDRQARAISLPLAQEPWLELILVPRKMDGGAIAIAWLLGDLSPETLRLSQLGTEFHLTPSEARLALLIAHGSSLSDAADLMGVTEQTVRGYSKLVYAKTGARGQPDLVRIVMAALSYY